MSNAKTVDCTTLTTIGGGINRLRTKAMADKSSLYDLLNGYVTQSNTVKVRPGTYRNANIAQYSGVGMTKGLVAWEGDFHVFGSSVVDVPPGYQLHVLSHPSVTQLAETENSNTTLTSAAVSTEFPFSGTWEANGTGYSSSSAPGNHGGTIDPVITPQNCGIVALGNVHYGGNHYVILVMAPTWDIAWLTSISLTLDGGSENTYTAAEATYHFLANTDGTAVPGTGTSPAGTGGAFTEGYPTYMWETTNIDFAAESTTAVVFDPIAIIPSIIPLKEIHFAAPYLGGLYVVAEFDVTTTSVLNSVGSVFHYWIQSSTGGSNANEWTPKTDVQIGQVMIPTSPNGFTYIASRKLAPNPVWAPSTQEALDNIVEPTVANGFKYTVTAVLGANPTTSTTEPTWPTQDGATVQENSSLANDQSASVATAADAVTTPTTPTRYANIAGGA